MTWRRALRGVGGWLAVGVGYAALSEIGFRLTLPPSHVAVYWPAAGLAAGLLIRHRPRRWPFLLSAIACANLVGNLAHGKPLVGRTLIFVLGNLLEPAVCAWAVRTLKPRSALAFLRSATTAALLSTASVGAFVALTLTPVPGATRADAFWSWALGDALGILLVAPLCAPMRAERGDHRPTPLSGLTLFTVAAASVLLLGSGDVGDAAWRIYLLAPMLLLVAVRSDRWTVSASLLVIGTVGVWSLAHGQGPLAHVESGQLKPLAMFQLLLALFVIPTHALNDLVRASHRTTDRLRVAEQRFTVAMLNSPVAMAIRDAAGRAVMVNEAYADLVGRNVTELRGVHWTEHTDIAAAEGERRRREHAVSSGESSFVLEKKFVRPDGSCRDAVVHLAFVRDHDGRVVQELVQAIDVTDDRLARDRLRHRAEHDHLTGLLNRAGFENRARALLDAPGDPVSTAAVIVIDLDGFKLINDRYGHRAGDEVLKAVAGRLRASVHGADVVARVGGDEFIVALGVTEPDDARAVAARLLDEVRQAIHIAGTADELNVTASIGVAIDTSVGASRPSLERLTELGDHAMYQAKRTAPGNVTSIATTRP